MSNKQKYLVLVHEVHVSTVEVEAESVEEAINNASSGEEVICEYSHTLHTDTWSVEDEEGNVVRDQIVERQHS
jgi:hypothetical protein